MKWYSITFYVILSLVLFLILIIVTAAIMRINRRTRRRDVGLPHHEDPTEDAPPIFRMQLELGQLVYSQDDWASHSVSALSSSLNQIAPSKSFPGVSPENCRRDSGTEESLSSVQESHISIEEESSLIAGSFDDWNAAPKDPIHHRNNQSRAEDKICEQRELEAGTYDIHAALDGDQDVPVHDQSYFSPATGQQ